MVRLTSTPRTPVPYPYLQRVIAWSVALCNLDFRGARMSVLSETSLLLSTTILLFFLSQVIPHMFWSGVPNLYDPPGKGGKPCRVKDMNVGNNTANYTYKMQYRNIFSCAIKSDAK